MSEFRIHKKGASKKAKYRMFFRGGAFFTFPLFDQLLSQNNVQCPPLNWITSGRIKSDNINRMIQLTEVTFMLKNFTKMKNVSINYNAP